MLRIAYVKDPETYLYTNVSDAGTCHCKPWWSWSMQAMLGIIYIKVDLYKRWRDWPV